MPGRDSCAAFRLVSYVGAGLVSRSHIAISTRFRPPCLDVFVGVERGDHHDAQRVVHTWTGELACCLHPVEVRHPSIEKADVGPQVAWTGSHLQMTLMSIEPGRDVGLEVHPRAISSFASSLDERVQMGPTEHDLPFDEEVGGDWAILVAAGVWHNISDIDDVPLKLYAIYGPPEHPHGTVDATVGTPAELNAETGSGLGIGSLSGQGTL